MVFTIQELSAVEFLHLAEVAIQLSDGLFNIDHGGEVHLVHWQLGEWTIVFDEFAFHVLQGEQVYLQFLFQSLGSFQSVGGVDQQTIVLIRVHQTVYHIGWSLHLSVFVVRGVLEEGHQNSGIALTHFNHFIRVEIGKIVIHFWGEFISKTNQFVHLTA